MKNLSYFLCLFCLAFPSLSYGDSRAFVCGAKIDKGEEILASVQSQYGKIRGMKARFTQESFLAALDVTEGSAGTVWVSQPGQMKWLYTTPEAQTFLISNETLWFYQPEANQLLIDSFKTAFATDVPVSFLMGVGDLGRDFKLVGACKSSLGVILELRSRKANDETLKAFKLLVSPSDYSPIGAQVVDAGDNRTTIVLQGIERTDVVSADIFRPDFPTGIDVMDRRVNVKPS